MKKYKLVCKKGEGTFSEVVKAENVNNGKQYAIKCMKSSFESHQQVNNLREIQALRRLTPHPHIINLEEVLFDEPSGRLAMVFELMEANLYDLISGRREHLEMELVQSLGYQMFVALEHMHDKGIFHRDIKPENILVDSTGKKLKLADLGSCRSINAEPPMTEYIATRWYRSPECLLTDGHYGPEMDIWGAGCVLFEIIALFPLFPGADEVDQINRIHKVVGTPGSAILEKLKQKGSSKINYNFSKMKGIGIKHFISHAPADCVNLLEKTLIYDHTERINAMDTIDHSYFSKLRENDTALSERKKSSLRKNARVEDDKPLPSHGGRDAKDAALPDDKPRRKIKIRSKTNPDDKLNNLKSIKSTLNKKANNTKSTKSKNTNDKESNNKNISGLARRRRLGANNPKLSKFDKNKTKSDANKAKKDAKEEKLAKPTGRRKQKYSNVQSSGYGRTNYKPAQPKPLNSRIRQPKGQNSAGTEKTAQSSLPSVRDPNAMRSSRLTTNKKSLQRNADKTRRREKASTLPRIKA